jgi:probable HAF family extracellular repeat protein
MNYDARKVAGIFMKGIFANFLRPIVAAFLIIAAFTMQASAQTQLACVLPASSCLDEVDSSVSLTNRTPLILIHGWNHDPFIKPAPPLDWSRFVSYFNSSSELKNTYKLYRVTYFSNSIDLIGLGHALRDLLDKANANDPQSFGNKKISIVAHSMGGLIAKYYMRLQQQQGTFSGQPGGERVLKLITLGTPYHGSPVANGPARNAKAGFGWGSFLNVFNLGVPPYDQANRSDLYWDNYHPLFDYVTYATERNFALELLNSHRTYDGKIVAYAGSTSPNDEPLLSVYGAGSTVLGGVFDLASDGIVPVDSAQFAGHTVFKTWYFPGYNHDELAAGQDPADTKIFEQIRRDLAVVPSLVTSDLRPLNITLTSPTLAPGESFTANWTIANLGNAAANATSTTVVRINQSPTKATGTNLVSIGTPAMGVGSPIPQSTRLTAPSTPGKWYVWVIADNFNTVTNQSDRSNDLQPSGVFTVTGASSDLIPLSQTIAPSSPTVTAGATFMASWTLKNNGIVAANAASTTVVRINQSTQSAAPKNNLAGVSTEALGAGASVVQTATLTAPPIPGTYYIWVIADNFSEVTNQVDTNNDLQHSAAFTVVAATNALQVTPATNMAASGPQGGPFTQSSIDYQVSASSGTVNYSISVTYANPGVPNWLTITPTISGEVGTSPIFKTVSVNNNAQSLSPGTYNATITFTNTGSGQNTQRTATLTVNAPTAGALQVSPGTETIISGKQGGPFSPGSFSYTIKSTSGIVEFTVSTPIWFTASITSGSLGPAELTISFTVNENANNFSTGSYPSNITFTNITNGQGTQTRATTVNVSPPVYPTLQVSPATNISVSGNQGGPFSPQSFSYTLSSINGDVNYSILYVPSWLTPSSTSGTVTTAGSTVTFTVNPSANSLVPGGYNATILFSNVTSGFNGPGSQTRFATLVVRATGTGPSFQGLGFLPGSNYSLAFGVNADGTVAVGHGNVAKAFRWFNGNMTDLGSLPGSNQAEAYAVNSDGTVAVGEALLGGSNRQGFRWVNGNMTGISYLPGGSSSYARGVNADGTVVIGMSNFSGGIANQAYRWVNGTMTGLGFLPGHNLSNAYAVNSDGTVVAGFSKDINASTTQAFRWVNGSMTGLGFLPGGNSSTAQGVNSDGSVVVGYSWYGNSSNNQAFRWVNGSMTGLGFLPGGNNSDANAVNSDGTVVVGSSGGTGAGAVRWTAAEGMKSIASLLTEAGVNFGGWSLNTATGISSDGSVIIGNGSHSGNSGGWIARLPLPVPTLQVTPPTDIVSSGTQGGPFSPSPFQIQLSTSTGSVGYSISGVPNWLTASATSGTLSTSPTTVIFTVNASANSLPPGTYSATITVTNTTNAQGNATRTATLTVNAPAILQLTPSTGVSASGIQGGPFSPSSFSYTLSSTSGSIGYSISGLPSWLTVSSTSGTTTTAGTTVTFTMNASANSLAPGSYDTIITFTNTTNGQGTLTGAATLTVGAVSHSYTISVSADPPAGGTVSGGGTFAVGGSRTVTAIANSGYTFANWTEGGSVVSTSASYNFTLSGNRILVANFTQVNYTITVSASPSAGGSVSGGGTFMVGSSRTVTATANTGYTFASWTEGGSVVSTSASYTFTLNGSRTLVANFSQQNYTVTLSASPPAGGSVSGAGTFQGGSSRTVTATPNSGFSFVNWTENGGVVSTSASYTFTLNANRTLVANFTTAPVLQVSPTTNIFASGSQGGPFSPSSFAYSLGATAGSLNYTISGVPSWLTASATSGTVATSPTTVTFTINAAGLVPGTFGAVITFTNADTAAGTTTRKATLNVLGTSQTSIVSAVAPNARTTTVGAAVTAFATIINAGASTATACLIAPPSSFPGSFLYQTTDPATNVINGSPNTPVDLPAGQAQTFYFAATPSELLTQEIPVIFGCSNAQPATSVPGLNTFLLSASTTPIPDMLSIADTLSHDAIAVIPGATGTGLMVAAAINISAGGTVTFTPTDTPIGQPARNLPLKVSICQTDPANGQCTNPSTPGSSSTVTVATGETVFFSIFIQGLGTLIAFDPAHHRIFLIATEGSTPVGEASVAVKMQ